MPVSPPLSCSVRACARPLVRRGHTYACPGGHTFDVSRSGYLNLLQPQDRRSAEAGDSKAAVDARARLLAAGVGRAVADAVVAEALALDLGARSVVADLGCGSGEILGTLARAAPITGIGIDLSTHAAERAARTFPALTWVVANADRRVPLLDGSAGLVLSIHGRRHPAECARVLAPGGRLLVAVPAHDDLVELRALIQGQGVERSRADAVAAEHDALFVLQARTTVRDGQRVERAALLDLLRGTYRGERRSAAARVEALDNLDVTLASDLLLFTPRGTAQGSGRGA